jgi:hypothetical protein
LAADHSDAFLAIRDSVLAMEQSERKRLVDLLGSMRDRKAPLTAEVVALLAQLVALGPADRDRLSAWFGKYVNAWGQVPSAGSQAASNVQRLTRTALNDIE